MSRSIDRRNRKTCCEECLMLDAKDILRNRQLQQHRRNLTWRSGEVWIDGATADIECRATSFRPHIHLRYGFTPYCYSIFNPDITNLRPGSIPPYDPVSYDIQLDSTPQHLGEHRYWFLCPLLKDGQTCARRVRRLYLPQTARYFGCRHCYNLVYRSSQEHNTRIEKDRIGLQNKMNAALKEDIHRYCLSHDFGTDTEERLFQKHKYGK